MQTSSVPQRSRAPMPLVLRVNAVVALVVGVVLLAATWKSLYEELDTFRPAPWVWAQLAGAALLAFAYMCWRAANGRDQQTVARGAAIFNVAAFVCIAIWLFSDDEGIPSSGSLGSWVIDVVAVVLLVLGILEARAFRRE